MNRFARSQLAAQGFYGPPPAGSSFGPSWGASFPYGGYPQQPYGYGAGFPQYFASQQGFAYDPASGSMMPYFAGDSGDPGDPNDPNSLYSRSRAYGSPYASSVMGECFDTEEYA